MKLVSSFEQNKINPQSGIQLDGLWLQGCDFDGVRLNDIRDTSGSSSEILHLPVCNIAWIRREDPEPYQSGTVVSFINHKRFSFRMFLYITLSIEKSSCAHSTCLITAMTGNVSLVVSVYSSTAQKHESFSNPI
jgi:hypothetical protein